MTEARTGSQAIERSLAILDTFTAAEPDLGISEIANRVGLSTSTAHRMIRALVAGGMLEQGVHSDRYRLGYRAVVMGQIAAHNLGMTEVAGLLKRLAQSVGESVSLGFLQGSEVVVAFRAEAREPLEFDRRPGAREFAHASAMGKVLLAYSGNPRRAVADLGDLVAFTPATVVDAGALIAELAVVRANGFAINNRERRPDASGVAVPVFDHDLRVKSALVVHGPSAHFGVEHRAGFVAALRESAKLIGEALAVT